MELHGFIKLVLAGSDGLAIAWPLQVQQRLGSFFQQLDSFAVEEGPEGYAEAVDVDPSLDAAV